MPAPDQSGGRKPLSIFLISRSLEVGGAERQLVMLAKGFAERGHGVTIALFYNRGDLIQDLRGSGVEIVDLAKGGRWNVAAFLARTIAAARRAKPNIVYGVLGGGNLVASVVRPFVRDARLVWSVRGSNRGLNAYDWVQRVAYRLECRASNSPDLTIANSSAGVDYSVRNGFPAGKFVVIPNGIDTVRFRPEARLRASQRRAFGLRDGEIAVGMLSRVEAIKGHADFLQAASVAAKSAPEMRFLCIGGGPDFRRIKAMADELGLSDRMIFAGDTDPVAALNAFDIFCSCSLAEGFSNSVAEAMACGLPCIVTAVGESANIVGELGMVVPPGSPELLAAAILEQAATLDRHDPERARARIVESFSPAAMVERTLAVFHERLGI